MMNVYVEESYEQMSEKAAEIIKEQLIKNPAITLGLATGETPLGLYKKLIAEYQDGQISFQDVKSVNLDEYLGLSRTDVNSYYHFMYEHFFKHVNIDDDQVHIPNGLAENPQQECERYEQVIQSLGKVDLQVLGIGVNGHIGFNEPGTPFDSRTHIVQLDESTRQANARFFPSIKEVPTQAITMGIETIMRSKQIILLASGKDKSEAIDQFMKSEITPQFPASVLHQHPNVTIILDHEAASHLSKWSKA